MKKFVAVGLLSLAAFGYSVAAASAGWFCHKSGHLSVCATQYNAFSPYCVQSVYSSRHCHKCKHPAEGPYCNQPRCTNLGGWGGGYGNTFAMGPAAIAHGDGATLGVLPAPAAPSPQVAVPQVPAPLPAIPGATSQVRPPVSTIEPLVSQP